MLTQILALCDNAKIFLADVVKTDRLSINITIQFADIVLNYCFFLYLRSSIKVSKIAKRVPWFLADVHKDG